MKITIETNQTERRKKEYSKLIVGWILAYLFFIISIFMAFVCYMMYKTDNLAPVEYIAPALFGAFAFVCGVVVSTYMWRAKQKDYVQLDVERNTKLSKLKKEFGENFVYEETKEVEHPSYNG